MIQRMFVTLDTKKTNYKNVGKINHGDDLILELTVLSDGNMISFNNPMVDLLVKKSDGKMIRQNSGIEHIKPNKFIIEVSKDCVTSPGLSTNQLIINDNGRISTCMFYYTILNSLEEDIIESISNVEVLEQLDEFTIQMKDKMENFDEELQNRMSELEDAIDDLVEFFGDTSVDLLEAELSRNEAEQSRAQAESVRVQNENRRIQNDLDLANAEAERVRAENIRIQNEADRALVDAVMDQKESKREDSELERIQNESERATDELVRQQNENVRQSNEATRIANENDRKTQENRRATAETNRVNAETTRRNNENSRISNETERQKTMNEMKNLIGNVNDFDERVGVIEDEINEINSSLDDIAINILDYKSDNSWADAINKAMSNSNKLYLPHGVYDFSEEYKEIIFDGYELDFNNSVINNSSLLFRLKNSAIKNLTLTNRGVYINGSNCKLSNIRINPSIPYSIPYGFNIQTDDDTIENIIFENCISKNANVYGFNIMDITNSFTKGKVVNIKYINCQSINTGGDNLWATGFCIEGIKEATNILYENCYADNSMESGFHCEDAVSIKNIIYNYCISTNNGTRKEQPTFGAGFFAKTNIILNNCITKNNYTPIYKGKFPNIINHIEGNSEYRFTQNSYSNGIIGGNFEYGLAPFGRYSLYSSSFITYQIKGMSKDCFEVLYDNNDFVLRNLKNAGRDLYERSLQTNLIKINQNKTYEVSFHQKRFSGNEGKLILAITEFDAHINKVKSYSLFKGIDISNDWKKEIFVVGKGTDTNNSICVFDENTEYIDISIVFNYLDTLPTSDNNSTVIKKLKFEEF